MTSYTLVTGAAGFIGSRLTEKLLDSGRNVLALDCFLPNLYSAESKRQRWKNLKTKDSSKLELVEFDLRYDDFSKLDHYQIESVFNEAAMPGLVSNWANFAPYYECNLSALNRLVEYFKDSQIKSFVQASTSSVYGKIAVGSEDQDLKPTSPYGVSKHAAEKLLLAYQDWFNLPVKILRYFSVYGPYQRPDMAYAKIIDCVKTGRKFQIYGNGEQKRTNTYIDDIVEATILAEKLADVGDVMNICGDEALSLNEAIAIIEGISNLKLKVEYIEIRKGDQKDTDGANFSAKKKLGWSARTDFKTGITNQINAALT
jgi:UDP-glucose 4-epimerase